MTVYARIAFVAVLVPACGTETPETTAAASLGATAPGPLALGLTPSAPLVQGAPSSVTLTLTNTTADTISQITASANFTQSSVHATPAACTKIGGGTPLVFCAVPRLAAGESVALDMTVIPNAAGPVTFAASAGASGLPINTLNDDEVVAPAATDVQVTGSSNQGSPAVGSSYVYTFQVKNNGPFTTAGDVTFSDRLPAGVGFTSVATSIGACTGGESVVCDLGVLGTGTQATIAIAVVAPSSRGPVVNTATAALAAAQVDRQPANNSVTVTVTPK